MPGCVPSYTWALTGLGSWPCWAQLALHFFLRRCNVQSWLMLRHLLRACISISPITLPMCDVMLLFIVWHHNNIYKNGKVTVCAECQSRLLSPGVTMYLSVNFFWGCSSKGIHYFYSNTYQLGSVSYNCFISFTGYTKIGFLTVFVSVLVAWNPFMFPQYLTAGAILAFA